MKKLKAIKKKIKITKKRLMDNGSLSDYHYTIIVGKNAIDEDTLK